MSHSPIFPFLTVLNPIMTTRRRAREVVLQLLYEDDLNPNHDPALAGPFIAKRMLSNKPLSQFALDLLNGVRKHRFKVDQLLSQKATNWSLRRMSAIDRNILRLATYEMVHVGTPGRVAINEAVEIAKRYGGKNSSTFVNGVLDRVLRELNEKQGESESAAVSEA
jgi:N utilization substance protein B